MPCTMFSEIISSQGEVALCVTFTVLVLCISLCRAPENQNMIEAVAYLCVCTLYNASGKIFTMADGLEFSRPNHSVPRMAKSGKTP